MPKTIRELMPIDADTVQEGNLELSYTQLDSTDTYTNKNLIEPTITTPTVTDSYISNATITNAAISTPISQSIVSGDISSGILTLPNSTTNKGWSWNAGALTVSSIVGLSAGSVIRIYVETGVLTLANPSFTDFYLKIPEKEMHFWPGDSLVLYQTTDTYVGGRAQFLLIDYTTRKGQDMEFPSFNNLFMYTPTDTTIDISVKQLVLTQNVAGGSGHNTVSLDFITASVGIADLGTGESDANNTWFYIWGGLSPTGEKTVKLTTIKAQPSSTDFSYYCLLGAIYRITSGGIFRKFAQRNYDVRYLEKVHAYSHSGDSTWKVGSLLDKVPYVALTPHCITSITAGFGSVNQNLKHIGISNWSTGAGGTYSTLEDTPTWQTTFDSYFGSSWYTFKELTSSSMCTALAAGGNLTPENWYFYADSAAEIYIMGYNMSLKGVL